MFREAIDLIELAADNRVLRTARILLSILFVIGISEFLFRRLAGEYSLIKLTDYSEMILFFIQAKFIQPLGLFILVLLITDLISFLLLKVSSVYFGNKISQSVESALGNKFIERTGTGWRVDEEYWATEQPPKLLIRNISFIKMATQNRINLKIISIAFLFLVRAFILTIIAKEDSCQFSSLIFIGILALEVFGLFILSVLTSLDKIKSRLLEVFELLEHLSKVAH